MFAKLWIISTVEPRYNELRRNELSPKSRCNERIRKFFRFLYAYISQARYNELKLFRSDSIRGGSVVISSQNVPGLAIRAD